ncbi:exported hypothetical protein [Plantibacter sp. T3]|nr:exported hypothetical protein [Plantibacter sp. T3]
MRGRRRRGGARRSRSRRTAGCAGRCRSAVLLEDSRSCWSPEDGSELAGEHRTACDPGEPTAHDPGAVEEEDGGRLQDGEAVREVGTVGQIDVEDAHARLPVGQLVQQSSGPGALGTELGAELHQGGRSAERSGRPECRRRESVPVGAVRRTPAPCKHDQTHRRRGQNEDEDQREGGQRGHGVRQHRFRVPVPEPV